MAKAPSLQKDWSKGIQRTRKLSMEKAPWMLEQCEGTLGGVTKHREGLQVLSRVR
jgi:hypothetical protein